MALMEYPEPPADAPRQSPGLVTSAQRRRLTVHGVVQGVGFRPFVWRLATGHGLAGWVRNTPDAVVIEAEGELAALDSFANELVAEAPQLARVSAVTIEEIESVGVTGFRIERSGGEGEAIQAPPPDAVVCSACHAELSDLSDRRYRYPFTNCTNCGPRFTIITALPYDRERTAINRFTMCDDCRREYEDPGDRRFHAEPVACPQCGPRLWLADSDGAVIWGDAIDMAAAALRDGAIVAIKGLGGFQLACDATNETIVALLRERKRRPAKPLAVMVADLAAARAVAEVNSEVASL